MDVGKDYYKILEISQNVTAEEIKTAYRKLAKKYHPDLHRNNALSDLASEKFKEVNEAYEVLSDESKKKKYDSTLNKSYYSSPNRDDNTEDEYNTANKYKKSTYNYNKSNKQEYYQENSNSDVKNSNAYNENTWRNNQYEQRQHQNTQRQHNQSYESMNNQNYRQQNTYSPPNYQSNQYYSCYMHKNGMPVTQCTACGRPLCEECANTFDIPICVDCLFENNDKYLKNLKLPLIVTIFTLIYGLIMGIILGIRFDIYSDYGILEGILFSIYLEGVWLYLHYYGSAVKNFTLKIFMFFDVSEEISYTVSGLLNILISIVVGWSIGLSFGTFRLVSSYKGYKAFVPEYSKTKELIKEKFGI